MRSAKEDPSERNAGQLQDTVEKTKKAMAQVDRAHWSAFPKAAEVFAKADALVEEAYAAMEEADRRKAALQQQKEAQEARAAEDKVRACAKPIADVLLAHRCSYGVTRDAM